MKSAAKSPVEMGLSSIANMFSQIYDATQAGNELLLGLREDLLQQKENVVASLSGNLKLANSLKYYSRKNDKNLQSIVKILQSSYEKLDNLVSGLLHAKSTTPDGNNLPAKISTPMIPDLAKTNSLLAEIAKNNSSSGKSFSLMNVEKVENIASQGKEKVQQAKEKIDLATMASSIVEMKKNLTTKMIKNFGKFTDVVKNMVDSADEKKAKTFEGSMDKISETLANADKKAKPAAKTFSWLSGALGLLTIAAISPTFGIATAAIGGLVWVLQKAGTGKEMTKGLPDFAKGVLLLSGSLLLMGFVNVDMLFKLVGFIAVLGLVLKSFTNDTKGNTPGSIVGFASGIGILTLAMIAMNYVQWNGMLMMLSFIGGLGLVMLGYSKMSKGVGMPGMPGIVGFAFGIGLLTLALLAFDSIPWTSAIKMIGFIAALGITLALTNRLSKGPTAALSGLPGFAFGLGLMVLAILAFNEIPWTSIGKMLTFIAILGIELAVLSRIGGGIGNMKGLPGFAFGLGLMVLAMYAMNELPIEAMFKTILFIGALGLVLQTFRAGVAKNMFLVAAGIIAISLGLWLYKKANISVTDAAILVGTILGVGLALMVLGTMASLIGLGVLATVGMAVGITLVGLALAAITNLPIVYQNIGSFALAVGILAAIFAVGTPVFLLAVIGSALFIPIAAAALLGALSLAAIGNLTYSNTGQFAKAALILAATFAGITPLAIIGVIGAALFIPIAVSAALGALSLMLISKLSINEKAIQSYGSSIKYLVNTINDLGIISLAKGAAKAALLIPIAVSLSLVAGLFRLISSLDISEAKMMSFSTMMNLFVSATLDTLATNGKRLKDATPGIVAIAKLASISKSLAETIQLMANMQFYEYEVRDGKLVLKNARKLTPEDMQRVGVNLATMLKCLIDPLVLLGSDDDVFVIGGQKIPNPFKDGRAQKGIEVVGAVGAAFKPLVEALKTFTTMPLASDPKALQQFNASMVGVINTLAIVLQKLENLKINNAKNNIATIQGMLKSFDSLQPQGFTSINDLMNKFVANLSDDAKWAKINKNLDTLKGQFKDIAKNINSIDLNRALSFERNLKALVDGNNSKKLAEVVENLKAVMELLNEKQQQNIFDPLSGASSGATPGAAPGQQPSNFVEKNGKTKKNGKETIDEQIAGLLSEVVAKLDSIGGRLNSTLKVQQVGGNGNSLAF